MTEQKLMAFWRYDLYPYYLWGEITKTHESGLVETVQYGKGNTFKPVKILPLKTGKALASELIGLRAFRNQELAVLDRKYLDKLRKLDLPHL